MTERDKKIIADAEAQGIPIFVFVAKDKLSADVIEEYGWAAGDAGCSDKFCNEVQERAKEFREWQDANPDNVNRPD